MPLSYEGLGRKRFLSHIKSLCFSTCIVILTACGGGGGGSSSAPADTTPDAFSFVDQVDVPLHTPITSAAITVAGINTATEISITGGEYSIDGGAFVTTAGTVSNDQEITVRISSASAASTPVNATLSVGGVADTFTVTTLADTTPNAFSFVDQTNVARNAEITSASITVSGISTAVPISITGGEYAINGGTFTSAAGTVTSGQTVAVKLTSASAVMEVEEATLTIGGVTDTFTVTSDILRFTNGQAASVVIGQDGFNTRSTPFTGNEDKVFKTVYNPPFVTDGYLYLPDEYQHRVLGYNSIPTENFKAADFVIGQHDFSNTTGGNAADELNYPFAMATDGSQFFISERDTGKIVVFNNLPTTNTPVANYVLGQTGFGVEGVNCTDSGLSAPSQIIVTNNKLVAIDYGHHRLLMWNLPIIQHGQPADVVLGQGDYTHCESNDDNQDGVNDGVASARTLMAPIGVWSDGQRLFVSDSENHRILIWNTFPDTNFQPADMVLGQDAFDANAINDTNQDGISDSVDGKVFNYSGGVHSNGEQLCIADIENHRVLLWNTIPTSNFTPADVVLGQQAMTLSTENDGNGDGVDDGTPTDKSAFKASSCLFIDEQLIVADARNFRYLIYNAQ